MSSPTNTAAWLMTKQQKPFEVAEARIPEPGAHEVLIKVGAIAINPVDAAIQNLGLLWDTYPLIIGSDLAGEVIKVGAEVTRIQAGDRVLACVESGAFQRYCIARIELVAKIPENVSYAVASVLPLGISTAAATLFQPETMALELPKLKPSSNGKLVLVWGGSSSVGSCAIQMLHAAGYEVLAVAGVSNAQYCMDIGAKHVFDHKNQNVERDLIDGIRTCDKDFAGVFSAIIDLGVLDVCIRVAKELGRDDQSRMVGTVIPPDSPFPLPELPDGIKLAFCKGPVDFLPESKLAKIFGWEDKPPTKVGPMLFEDWIPATLESGLLKCMPQPFVVGHGLESLQEACDLMSKGVSAKKLVVTLG